MMPSREMVPLTSLVHMLQTCSTTSSHKQGSGASHTCRNTLAHHLTHATTVSCRIDDSILTLSCLCSLQEQAGTVPCNAILAATNMPRKCRCCTDLQMSASARIVMAESATYDALVPLQG
jgi:hypothetical protein